MAIDRADVGDLGGNMVTLYSGLEARLIALLRDKINAAVQDPIAIDWAARQLDEVIMLREAASKLVEGVWRESSERASATILEAAAVGRRQALAEAGKFATVRGLGSMSIAAQRAFGAAGELPGAAAIARIAARYTGRLSALNLPVIRWVDDAFRRVIAQGAAPGILAGLDTRRKASERAWNQLLNEGVTGLTDSRGKRWNLSTYVEMATRTTTVQAGVEAHNGQLAHLGIDLVVVNDAPGECPLCRPWEGKILVTSGQGGARKIRLPAADDDRPVRRGTTTITGADPGDFRRNREPDGGYAQMVTVNIAGSVNEAREAGLFHPNCRHNISAYLPGMSTLPRNTTDVGLSEARVELRGLEREARKWKVRAAGALTPEAKAEARAKAKEISAKIETLIDERGGIERGLPRRPARERPEVGNIRR